MVVLPHVLPIGHQQVMELQELEPRFVHHDPMDSGDEQTKTKICIEKLDLVHTNNFASAKKF